MQIQNCLMLVKILKFKILNFTLEKSDAHSAFSNVLFPPKRLSFFCRESTSAEKTGESSSIFEKDSEKSRTEKAKEERGRRSRETVPDI